MKEHIIIPKLSSKQNNRHHLLPRSRGGTNDTDNIKQLDIKVHDALHRLFGNTTINEQIEQLIRINFTALRDEFREELEELLGRDKDYYYKNGIYLKK